MPSNIVRRVARLSRRRTIAALIMVLSMAAASSIDCFSRIIDVYPASQKRPLTAALNAASPHDTIRVNSGRYAEGLIVVSKPVALIGKGNPLIDGADTTEIFLVRADSVVISGFTIANTGDSYISERAGIRLEFAKHCLLENNVISKTCYGIYGGKSSDCIIRNNIIESNAESESGSGNGIHCWYCQNFTVENNVVRRHRDGMYFEFTTQCRIAKNLSEGNMRYGLHFMFAHHNGYFKNIFRENGSGVAVMYTNNIEMIGNVFEDNRGSASYGLLLKEISSSTIADNIFRRNTAGLYAEGGGSLMVRHNDFIDNGWALRLMADCMDNIFSHNNFVANTFDVSTNSYRNYSVFSFNYWDKYTGYDLDKNGQGDVPFRPVRLFSYIVEQNQPAMFLMHSFFVSLLELAESVFPSVTPETLLDETPSMTVNVPA